jgi:DNA-binding SARP family transcriptional activator
MNRNAAERQPRPPDEAASARIDLLGGFRVVYSERQLEVPPAAQRPLALLALQDRMVSRAYLAEVLWPDVSEVRAAGNLRSALWRLRRAGFHGVRSDGRALALEAWVRVDAHTLVERARALEAAEDAEGGARLEAGTFVGELLPEWDDDWVLVERERLRQLCLHALETLALALMARGRYLEATDAALAAVRAEPFRESAHRVLIRVHLAEGNVVEALRQFDRYRDLVRDELGIAPSMQMFRLFAGTGIVIGAVQRNSGAARPSLSARPR